MLTTKLILHTAACGGEYSLFEAASEECNAYIFLIKTDVGSCMEMANCNGEQAVRLVELICRTLVSTEHLFDVICDLRRELLVRT